MDANALVEDAGLIHPASTHPAPLEVDLEQIRPPALTAAAAWHLQFMFVKEAETEPFNKVVPRQATYWPDREISVYASCRPCTTSDRL